MMYVKLIVRNLKRSTKEYALYVMTLTISVTLMYAFNGVAFSKQIRDLAKIMDSLAGGIALSSVIIIFVMGWLVYYISNFILQKRSHEFGMYMLMGMTRKQVSTMFLMEQLCMGLFAFVLGCILGSFVYQVLVAIIMNLFEKSFAFNMNFNTNSLLLTLLYFSLIYVVELVRERIFLKRRKIYTLLYSGRKNETNKKSGKLSILYFLFGIMSYCIGLKSLQEGFQDELNTGLSLLMGIGFTILSIFLIYFGLSYVIVQFVNRRKCMKYRGNTLYLSSQITTRLKTSRMVLALLSILTLSTFLLVSIGIKFSELKDASEKQIPFDITASCYVSGCEINTNAITKYLEEQKIPYQDDTYYTYRLNYMFETLGKSIAWGTQYDTAEDFHYIKYSDYKRVVNMLDEPAMSLDEDEYLILTSEQFKEPLKESGKDVTIENLHLKDVVTQEVGFTRYDTFVFIVPDVILKDAQKNDNGNYIVKAKEESNANWSKAITEQFAQDNSGYLSLIIKYEWMMQMVGSLVTIMFSMIYLAIIFACISATVLSIQQMSDVYKQRKAYLMLWKMGVSKREVYTLLKKQLAIYFFIPFVIPVLYLFPLIAILEQLFEKSYVQASMWSYAIFSILFYLGIYVCYYMLAYLNSKRSIELTDSY